jgi:type I restriction enzyme S subunit
LSLDEAIATHSQKLNLLKDHKKALMQNLFPQEGETNPKYRFPDFTRPLSKVGFADLGDIKIGLTHKPDYISSGVPFLSSKNISGGFINFNNVQYISSEKFESMPESTKPKFGDILFTRVGSNLGNPIVLERKIEFGIFVSLGAFRVNKKANNIYIKYWMESDLFWKQVNQKVAGGAKDNLNSNWLREFELFIPSIEEQQKIASCLSSLDALITAQAEKIEQLKQHKKGLMQGLFPKINE